MLLNPTMRSLPREIAPKRLEVLTMGSPSVFHTAPPQPASKARMTWSPVLVGGALASQKGLGIVMPAKSMERSAMIARALLLVPRPHGRVGAGLDSERGADTARGTLAVLYGGHDQFAAVHGVAAGEDLGVTCGAAARVRHQ